MAAQEEKMLSPKAVMQEAILVLARTYKYNLHYPAPKLASPTLPEAALWFVATQISVSGRGILLFVRKGLDVLRVDGS
tara:strand:- start:34 stop:267 length:234 start_codon:yes stop_codon:yes gene_type:complete